MGRKLSGIDMESPVLVREDSVSGIDTFLTRTFPILRMREDAVGPVRTEFNVWTHGSARAEAAADSRKGETSTRGIKNRPAFSVLPSAVRIIHTILLAALLVAVPIILAAAAYAFMWVGLCLVRFIPLIGRKHRHPDWDRLNR
jgi:hypothetical protein